jgi:hypothetical protein
LANKEEFKVKNTAVFIACPVKKKAIKKKHEVVDDYVKAKIGDPFIIPKKSKKSKDLIEHKISEDSDEHEKIEEESDNE